MQYRDAREMRPIHRRQFGLGLRIKPPQYYIHYDTGETYPQMVHVQLYDATGLFSDPQWDVQLEINYIEMLNHRHLPWILKLNLRLRPYFSSRG